MLRPGLEKQIGGLMSDQRAQWLALRDARKLRGFYRVLKALYLLHPHMTTPQATTFLYVAMSQEAFTVSTLATLSGVNNTTVSKYLRDLGEANYPGRPSLGLLTVQNDPFDRRQHRVVLTKRGVMVARMLAEIMRGQRLDLTDLPDRT